MVDMGWSGDTLLEMADGQAIRVHNLRRGIPLRDDLGNTVRVQCVVVTTKREERQRTGRDRLVSFDYEKHMSSNSRISEFRESHRPVARGHSWNPILVPGRSKLGNWLHLKDACLSQEDAPNDTETYDVILEKGQRGRMISVFGNVFIPTLGHNHTDDVIRHPYFGTDAVIQDLEKVPGYDQGRAVICEEQYERSSDVTNIVCGIRATPYTETCSVQ